MKKILCFLCLFLIGTSVHAQAWVNDTKDLFNHNQAVILTVNIRTFGANDKNHNGIIETEKGEERGNFVNALSRLEEVEKLGVNTIHLLPINTVGVKNAKGTAGSLFAISDFSTLDKNLASKNNFSDVKVEAKEFVEACHRRNIRVLVEMPAFAAYDLYLKKPRLFIKNKNRNSNLLKDNNDLRILNDGTKNTVNQEVYNLYESYIDLLMSLNVDGVVVQNPYIKSLNFWNMLISRAKSHNENFIFVAEMTPSQKKSDLKQLKFVKLEKLLKAGFDTYLGDFNCIRNWTLSNDLFNKIKYNNKLTSKFKNKKSVIGDFTTYFNVAPILVEDVYLSKMIIWLNSTLPVNAIYTDGFQTGDDYNYDFSNMKTTFSSTDNNLYYVERGKLDIYNFSRRPKGSYEELLNDFRKGNEFKSYMSAYLPDAKFIPLKTIYQDVFAYAMTDINSNNTVFVFGSFDLENIKKVELKISGLNKKVQTEVIKGYVEADISRGKIATILAPGDIQVFLVKNFSIK